MNRKEMSGLKMGLLGSNNLHDPRVNQDCLCNLVDLAFPTGSGSEQWEAKDKSISNDII